MEICIMDTERRNAGIILSVVIATIIIILLVLFVRPKETTKVVENVIDTQALQDLEHRFSRTESEIDNLRKRLNSIDGLETNIQDEFSNIQKELEKSRKEINQLKANFTTMIILGILLLILLAFLVVRKYKINKIGKSKPLSSSETSNSINEHHKSVDDVSMADTNKSDSKKDTPENTANLTDETDEQFSHNHGSFTDLSGREQKSALNSSFTPKD